MRIYLDNCCFNRPFDDQSSMRIKLEMDAKLFVQAKIRDRAVDLVWSYILYFENAANPFEERRTAISKWRKLAVADITENELVIGKAARFFNQGLRAKDALHLSCAIAGKCEFFLTTDDLLLKRTKDRKDIITLNPVDFVTIIEKQ